MNLVFRVLDLGEVGRRDESLLRQGWADVMRFLQCGQFEALGGQVAVGNEGKQVADHVKAGGFLVVGVDHEPG